MYHSAPTDKLCSSPILHASSLGSTHAWLAGSMGAAQRSALSHTPWRLRDYDPSPAHAARPPRGMANSHPVLASTLHPSPLSQLQQQGSDCASDDDGGDYGGYSGGCALHRPILDAAACHTTVTPLCLCLAGGWHVSGFHWWRIVGNARQ